MKLEIKHLAPYLPYGLMMSNQAIYNRMPFELVGIKDKHSIVLYGDWSGGTHNTFGNSCYGLTSWEPLLRPLSDLTKEIEHNGERFVPIKRLLKGVYDPDSETKFKEDEYVTGFDVNKGYYCSPSDLSYYWISFDGFSFDHQDNESTCPLQLNAWEKLCEWHFDIHGLIEARLAIDINTES